MKIGIPSTATDWDNHDITKITNLRVIIPHVWANPLKNLLVKSSCLMFRDTQFIMIWHINEVWTKIAVAQDGITWML